MRKFILAFALLIFCCSLALATDGKFSARDLINSDLVVVEKEPAANAGFNGVDANKEQVNKINTPDHNIILQGGDTVSDATVVSGIEYSNTGSTSGYSDDYDEACPYTGSTSPDVVYSYTPDSDIVIDIDLYGSSYDTKVFVYENEVTEGDPFGCNDDYYDDYTSYIGGLELTGGNTYYIVIDGYLGAYGSYVINITEGIAPTDDCPEGSIYNQEVIDPSDDWYAATSDANVEDGYTVYDNFSVSGDIDGIRFWGIHLMYADESWYICTENDPAEFEIVFYEDDSGVPGTVVGTYSLEISAEEANLSYSGAPLYVYTAELSPAVSLTSGWVSVQGVSDPSDCWFLWMSSPSGDGSAYQGDGSTISELEYDLSFCLTGSGGSTDPDAACEQDYVGPSGDWAFYTSDTEYGPYVIYDDFYCENETEICGVRFWGIDINTDGEYYYDCSEDPTEMEIIIYPDDEGAPDIDNPTCSYTVVPEITYTGISYSDLVELLEYYVEFETCCPVNNGWISIQGTLYDGNVCMFMWSISEDGNSLGYVSYTGGSEALEYDFARDMIGTISGVDDNNTVSLPNSVDMITNYPNPFNATTTIAFTLQTAGDVTIDIYDVLGRRVDNLNLGHMDNNQVHSVDYNANSLATGIYFYSLSVDGIQKVTERFSLLK